MKQANKKKNRIDINLIYTALKETLFVKISITTQQNKHQIEFHENVHFVESKPGDCRQM